MKLSWKVLIPASLALVLFVVLLSFPKKGVVETITDLGLVTKNSSTGTNTQASQQTTVIVAPKATGNIDDAVNAISAYSTSEANTINSDTSGSAVTDFDKNTVTTYGTTQDETQF